MAKTTACARVPADDRAAFALVAVEGGGHLNPESPAVLDDHQQPSCFEEPLPTDW